MLSLDKHLCFAIYSASHAFSRAYKPLLSRLELTYPQYLVLLTLWEDDRQPVKSLGARLHLDSGTLSPLLKRLEKQKLVSRSRDEDDERKVIVALTEKGKALQSEAEKFVAPAIYSATGCTAEEAGELRDELIRLRQSLENAADDSNAAA
ncbi:MarR family winged helix-turn-helix transcriptional regulator [Rhizobium sp. L1K21]|uniref:MarR family winged helix-turn-helix transcriptional regulator n=1 Tax=Rhizobium sp. L1K21 TaxID=2954933 RepID=UPI002093D050|nr:MarR family transcriptional regulator [Rhizobium sp. L1K21]MCO6185669.1 MarR family transcriptional regulator [Rhizobium sp. L1K21]